MSTAASAARARPGSPSRRRSQSGHARRSTGNPCTSSQTRTTSASRAMTWAAYSKHRVHLARADVKQQVTRGWTRPGAGGRPAHGNGCSSAGRGPPNSRSQRCEPIPATTESPAPGGPESEPTRCSAATSPRRSRTTGSPARIHGHDEERSPRCSAASEIGCGNRRLLLRSGHRGRAPLPQIAASLPHPPPGPSAGPSRQPDRQANRVVTGRGARGRGGGGGPASGWVVVPIVGDVAGVGRQRGRVKPPGVVSACWRACLVGQGDGQLGPRRSGGAAPDPSRPWTYGSGSHSA